MSNIEINKGNRTMNTFTITNGHSICRDFLFLAKCRSIKKEVSPILKYISIEQNYIIASNRHIMAFMKREELPTELELGLYEVVKQTQKEIIIIKSNTIEKYFEWKTVVPKCLAGYKEYTFKNYSYNALSLQYLLAFNEIFIDWELIPEGNSFNKVLFSANDYNSPIVLLNNSLTVVFMPMRHSTIEITSANCVPCEIKSLI